MNKHIFIILALFVHLTITGQVILYPPDTTNSGGFGADVELDANYLFIAGNLNLQYGSKGVVFVYKFQDTIPVLVDTLSQIEGDLSNVVAYGDFLLVSGFNNILTKWFVNIYNLKNGKWRFFQRIQSSDGQGFNAFGWAFDIYKDYLIVGAPYDNYIAQKSGAAYIFHLENGKWKEIQKLKPSGLLQNEKYGSSTAIYDSLILVGTPVSGLNNGSVYTYRNTDTGWVNLQKLIPTNNTALDEYGFSVDIGPHFSLVGAPAKSAQWPFQGAVYSYDKSETGLVNENILLAPDALPSETFGKSISIYNNYFAIGNEGKINNSGKVYVFYKSASSSVLSRELYPVDINHPYLLGFDVSIEGNRVAAGAPVSNSSNTMPSAYVYTLCGLPSISSSKSNPVCPGDSVHLQAGCFKDSVNWYNKNGLLVANSRNYNLIASGNDTIWADIWTKGVFTGYAGSDTIVVQAAPQANFQSDTVCKNQPLSFTDLSFTGTAVSRYFWDFDNDGVVDDTLAGNTVYTYTTGGIYPVKLKIINSFGCADSITKMVWVKTCTGLEPQPSISSLSIVPNPNRGDFHVIINAKSFTELQIQLSDLSGRIILSREETVDKGRQTFRIDANNAPAGVYFLMLKTGREVLNRKVVLY